MSASLPRPGQVANGPARWPWGTAWYLYGGKVVEYLATARGDEALAAYNHTYGSNLVPWAMNVDLAGAAGGLARPLRRMGFVAAEASLRHREKEIVEAQGACHLAVLRTYHQRDREPEVEPRRQDVLLHRGHFDATAQAAGAGIGRRRRIRLNPQSGDTGGNVAPPGGRGGNPRQAGGAACPSHLGDLFRVVDADGQRRLTEGARASEVDVSGDGRYAVS